MLLLVAISQHNARLIIWTQFPLHICYFSGCCGPRKLWDREAGLQRGGRHQLRHEDPLQEEAAEEGRHLWEGRAQQEGQRGGQHQEGGEPP